MIATSSGTARGPRCAVGAATRPRGWIALAAVVACGRAPQHVAQREPARAVARVAADVVVAPPPWPPREAAREEEEEEEGEADEEARARTVELIVGRTVRGAFDADDDDDARYGVMLEATRTATIVARADHDGTPVEAALWFSGREVVRGTGVGRERRIEFTPPFSGQYVLRLRAVGARRLGYTLRVEVAPAQRAGADGGTL